MSSQAAESDSCLGWVGLSESEGAGQPFLFRGAPYLAVMDEEEEDWNR
jgi:hypothetical protein